MEQNQANQQTPRTDARKSWDRYFFDIAILASERATCDRLHAGCVLVRNRQIISTGYNGSLSGEAHCDNAGHLLLDNHCIRTIHAEINAIASAARNGSYTQGCTAYVTHYSCYSCIKAMIAAGINRILFDKTYTSALKTWPIGMKKEFLENINTVYLAGVPIKLLQI
ncbi:cytidine/deoxycytidylate deaminase family protein [Patescibacteria group bacterium]|nr:cytidine/deoxycytidylate deaminase family protein [Patescibacteria group bacterium]